MKKVIITGAHYYNSPIQVGNHHIARLFAKNGYRVLFLSEPITPFHRFSGDKSSYQARKELHKKGGERFGDVISYVPWSLLAPRKAPLLSSKWMLWNWDRFSSPGLEKKVRELGFSEVDILWMESTHFAPLLKKIKYRKMISRIADDLEGFDSIDRKIFRNVLDVLRQSDDIVFSSKIVLEKYREYFRGIPLHHVENGFDPDAFNRPSSRMPQEYGHIPSPRAVYVGSVENWFDEELMEKCAERLKNLSFVIIGPQSEKLRQLSRLENVHLLGPKPYDAVPGYLRFADVGLIPFDTKKYKTLVEGVDPLKLYEYMACGLPVVSTRWKTLEEIDAPIHLSGNSDEFIENIEKSLKSGKSSRSKEFLTDKSWEAVFKKIQAIL